MDRLEDENNSLARTVERVRDRNEALETEIETLETSIASLDARNGALETVIEGLEATIETLRTENDMLRSGDAAAEPTDEPTDAASVPSGEFTRANPGALGKPATVHHPSDDVSWEVTLGAPTFNADGVVAAVPGFNDPAPDGHTYVIVPVTATYHGDSLPSRLWIDLEITFVTASGNGYGLSQGFVRAPDDLSEVGDVYDGGTGSGNLAMTIPVGAENEPGATWAVRAGSGDPVFFAAT